MKKNSILLIILAICLSISSNACFCSKSDKYHPDEDDDMKKKEKKNWILKIERTSPIDIDIHEKKFFVKLLKEGPDACYCDWEKITMKVSTSPNDHRLSVLTEDPNVHSHFIRVNDQIFDPRFKYHGSRIEFRIEDTRLPFPPKVEIKLELLYDGKLLENTESKIIFFW